MNASPSPTPPAEYQQEPKRKSHFLRNCLVIGAILVVIAVVVVVLLIALIGKGVDTVTKDVKQSHSVVYKVTGTATKVDVTYTNDGGTSTEQQANQKVPFTKKLTIPGDFFQVYQVMAQNNGAKGSVTCEILLDGKSVKKATSSGQYSIASCDYSPS